MKPIIRWTLWQRRMSTMWWSVGLFGMLFATIIFYPSFKDQAEELQKGFENIPDAALQLLGGSADFFSPIGFLNSQVFFLVLPLLLGILAIGLGSSLLAREEQDGTIESLLARPVSRTSLLAAKAISAEIVLGMVSLVGLVSTIVLCRIVDIPIAAPTLVATFFVCYLMCLSFCYIAYAITALGRARSASLGLTALIALGGYIISSLAGTVGWLRIPSKALPFHYYQSEALLSGRYNWANVLYFVGAILVSWTIAWVAFRRRDIG